MYRVLDGKIAEHFANRDDIGMMRQLVWFRRLAVRRIDWEQEACLPPEQVVHRIPGMAKQHYFFKLIPPRPSFTQDLTDEERRSGVTRLVV